MTETLVSQNSTGSSSAAFSECGQYRYLLVRRLGARNGRGVLFVMLNPSTADHEADDPTIRRCKGFADRFDCEWLVVANLYALRATNPKDLWKAPDPVGPANYEYLSDALDTMRERQGIMVCAWGANARPNDERSFLDLARAKSIIPWCLGKTKAGSPKHPLYLPADAPLVQLHRRPLA